MRAIVQHRYGLNGALHLAEADRPAIGPKQVLVRVHAAGVDTGAWHLTTGLPYMVRPAVGLRRPRSPVPGMDLAGEVVEVGSEVTQLAPGDAVYGAGSSTFAEYACAREADLAPKPAPLTFEQAAAVPVSGVTALQAVRDAAAVEPGQQVLVIGAGGGVGSFAVQLARAFGAEVTAVCSGAKAELARSLGAAHVLDYTRGELDDPPRRYDALIDTAGRRPLSRLRRLLQPRGTAVLVGGDGGGRWLGGFDRQLRAAVVSPFVRQRLRPLLSRVTRKDLLALTSFIDSGQLSPVIGRTYALAEAAEALTYIGEGHAQGKVVLRV